jgi:hypothetical protein
MLASSEAYMTDLSFTRASVRLAKRGVVGADTIYNSLNNGSPVTLSAAPPRSSCMNHSY